MSSELAKTSEAVRWALQEREAHSLMRDEGRRRASSSRAVFAINACEPEKFERVVVGIRILEAMEVRWMFSHWTPKPACLRDIKRRGGKAFQGPRVIS